MRIATAILIVLAAVTIGRAQQLERPPFYPSSRDVPNRPLFPTAPPDPRFAPFWSIPQAQQPVMPDPFARQSAVPPPVTPQRSGPACLMSLPVDPSIDRAFVQPVPDTTRSLPMRRIEMPPCVMPSPQPPR